MAAVRADLAEMRRKPLWSGDNDVVDYPGECVTPSTPVATSTPASAPTTGGAAPESAAAAAPAQAPREPQVADADPMACPECGSMLARRSTAGGGAFWGCSDFPRCRGTRPDDGGSPMVAAPPVPCKICGTGMMRQLCGKRGRYWRCDNASCGTTANDEGGSPSCGGHGSSQERALLSRRKRAPKGTVLGEHAMPLQWRPDGATAAVPEHEDDGDA